MNAKLLRYANALEQLRGIILAHQDNHGHGADLDVTDLIPVLETAEVSWQRPVPNSQQEMQLQTAKRCLDKFVEAVRSGDPVKITYALWCYERVYEGSTAPAPPKESHEQT